MMTMKRKKKKLEGNTQPTLCILLKIEADGVEAAEVRWEFSGFSGVLFSSITCGDSSLRSERRPRVGLRRKNALFTTKNACSQ